MVFHICFCICHFTLVSLIQLNVYIQVILTRFCAHTFYFLTCHHHSLSTIKVFIEAVCYTSTWWATLLNTGISRTTFANLLLRVWFTIILQFYINFIYIFRQRMCKIRLSIQVRIVLLLKFIIFILALSNFHLFLLTQF